MNVLVQHDINVRNIVIWPFTNAKTEICGAAHAFGERAKSASWSLNANTQYVNSDGVTVGSYTGTPRGSGTLGLTELTAGEREMLLSNKITAVIVGATSADSIEVVNTGKNDVAPCVRMAFMTDCDDGTVNLYKFLRAQFSPYEKNVDQINESGQPSFATISLPFTFFNTFSQSGLEGKLYEAKHVNPSTSTGAAFIANWFADGDFVGSSTGMSNTSSIKVGTTVIQAGGTIASGSTVTFDGSASGGTSPYKYSFYYQADGSDTWTAVAENSSTASATASITVTADTLYSFRIVAIDSNGVAITKTIQATITAPSE